MHEQLVHLVLVHDDQSKAEEVAQMLEDRFDPTHMKLKITSDSDSANSLFKEENIDACLLLGDEAMAKWPQVSKDQNGSAPPLIGLNIQDKALAEEMGAVDTLNEQDLRPGNLKRVIKSVVEYNAIVKELMVAQGMLAKLGALEPKRNMGSRRFFDKVLEKEWARAVRDSTPLSLVFIDIDNLNNYNDFFGVDRGDKLIDSLASVIKARVYRATDSAAHYDGGKFGAILTNTRSDGAEKVAQFLTQTFAKLAIDAGNNKTATASVGVATCAADHTIESSAIVAMADEALHQAKKGGGNQARCYQAAAMHVGPSVGHLSNKPHRFAQSIGIATFLLMLYVVVKDMG